MDIDLASLTLLDRLQADIAGRIGADEFFSDVPVLAQNKGVVEDDIAQALATMTAKATGKMGAAVVVLLPERSVPRPNSPILAYELSIVIRAMELPLLNRGESGTNKTCSAISLRIEHLLHQLVIDGCVLRAVRTGGLQQDSGGLAADVTISFNYVLPIAQRVANPSISISDSVATLTCATPGASIRYSLDGSYPGLEGIQYSAPFAVESGITIRAVASADGYQASSISETAA